MSAITLKVKLGRLADAEKLLQDYEEFRDVYPGDPSLATGRVEASRAMVRMAQGRYAEALVAARASEKGFATVDTPTRVFHAGVAQVLEMTAQARMGEGHALPTLWESARRRLAQPTADSATRFRGVNEDALVAIAHSLLSAPPELQRSVEAWAADPRDPMPENAHYALSEVALAQSKWRVARTHGEAAFRLIWTESPLAQCLERPPWPEPAHAVARSYVGEKRWRDALPWLEIAIAGIGERQGPAVLRVRFDGARALAETGQSERARVLVRQILTELHAQNEADRSWPASKRLLADIQAWQDSMQPN